MGDFFALAHAVAGGIGLPAGLLRWMRLVSIRSASHLSSLRERQALSAQTWEPVFSRLTRSRS